MQLHKFLHLDTIVSAPGACVLLIFCCYYLFCFYYNMFDWINNQSIKTVEQRKIFICDFYADLFNQILSGEYK